MNVRKNLYASICVNILVVGIFLLMLQELDVFMQLLFSFVPIILSIIVSVLINRDQNPERIIICNVQLSVQALIL